MTERGGSSAAKYVRIHIRGCIDPEWTAWFEGLDVLVQANDTTILQGELPDQSALYGILSRLRDLGIELLSVEQLD